MARDLGAERGKTVLYNTRYDELPFEAGGGTLYLELDWRCY